MEKLYEALGTVIGTLIIFIASSPIIDRFKKLRMQKRFGKRMEADEEIKIILTELRKLYGFNRSALVEYHNGNISLSGLGFKFATMTHESTDDCSNPLILDFQHIPTSLISSMLSELEKSPRGFVVVNQNHPDENIQVTNKMYGIVQSWNFKISDSLVDGSLFLTSINNQIVLNNEDILNIKAKCQKILLIKKGFI